MVLLENPLISSLESKFDLTHDEDVKVPVSKMSKVIFTIVDANGPGRKTVQLDRESRRYIRVKAEHRVHYYENDERVFKSELHDLV